MQWSVVNLRPSPPNQREDVRRERQEDHRQADDGRAGKETHTAWQGSGGAFHPRLGVCFPLQQRIKRRTRAHGGGHFCFVWKIITADIDG